MMAQPIAVQKIQTPIADRFISSEVQHASDATQDRVAQKFVAGYADRLRYDHSGRTWFEFDGSRWKKDETRQVFEYIRLTCREYGSNLDANSRRTIGSTGFAAGVEKFASSDSAIAVAGDQWDKDPMLLGTPGGTVELGSGRLRAAQCADNITRMTAVIPAGAAACPLWLEFIRQACGRDSEVIRFLQVWAGYCLTGSVSEHALLFIFGPGGNGKSVFLNTLARILGDYTTLAPGEMFAAPFGDRHPTELAMLRGARFVAASETEYGRRWAEARIKALTGGDAITARFMHRNFFTFYPNFKLTIVGNHAPQLHSVDDAIRRRIIVVEFTNRPAEVNIHLEEELRAEWSGILRWMIEGALIWQKEGLRRPAAVSRATVQYLDDQDHLSQWLEATCRIDPSTTSRGSNSSDLYRSWTGYCRSRGYDPGTQKALSGLLVKRGFQPARDGNGRGFAGLALKGGE